MDLLRYTEEYAFGSSLVAMIPVASMHVSNLKMLNRWFNLQNVNTEVPKFSKTKISWQNERIQVFQQTSKIRYAKHRYYAEADILFYFSTV